MVVGVAPAPRAHQLRSRRRAAGTAGRTRTVPAVSGTPSRGWRPHETSAGCHASSTRAISKRDGGGRRRRALERVEQEEGAHHLGVVAPGGREAEEHHHRSASAPAERDRVGQVAAPPDPRDPTTARSTGASTTRSVSGEDGGASAARQRPATQERPCSQAAASAAEQARPSSSGAAHEASAAARIRTRGERGTTAAR